MILRQDCLFVQGQKEKHSGNMLENNHCSRLFAKIQTSALNIELHMLLLLTLPSFFSFRPFSPIKIKQGSYHIRWIIGRLNKNSYNAPYNVFSERGRGSSKGAGRTAETGKRESFPERGGRTPRTEKGMPFRIRLLLSSKDVSD